ncbi:MAG: lipid-A-disaccharide synthase [Verrucomicrobiae bacterium]|nr:lipid-A-disaccharide synthase [Verrucomicrobiae bacterium]
MDHSLKIFILSGEASGDTYGAALMQALIQKVPSISFIGAGGPKMQIASLSKQIESSKLENQEASNTNFHQQTTDPHHPIKQFENWIEESAVVGLWDVLKKYSYFRAKFSQFLLQLQEEKPEAIILIDYPGFNLRLAQAIRRQKLPIKIFYYISPQVWAWNKNRIPKMARLLDLMICIFPFEKELYESSGLPTTFAGHPLVETIMASQKETPPLLRENNLLGLFPGSREREVRHLFPIMLQAFRELTQVDSKIRCEAAAATPYLAAMMQSMVQEAGVLISITIGKAPELMQRATFGLVCSGTATLEAACYALPYALVYKVAWLTYVVGKQLIRVPFLGIINILAGHLIVREFIQREATPRALAEEALRYLTDPQACEQVSKQLTEVTSTLHGQGAYHKAAATIISAL